ncbi:hypothetical protein [Lysinibacillus sp. Bpr_S20]|uniref:hypothetical protein n=1 Tax=Lysinibacillus sp. Bpr_S20 TaxID=2933964 RepID=UPI0020130FAA|nr:hypothetical protein [Lysinibacillus sp. Bpr_S20]MCL1697048.1 hypothetical protein [Lysinibacillus sp. BPa_S21]
MLKKTLFTISFALILMIPIFIINKILPNNDIRFILIGISCTIVIGFSQYLSDKWFATKE